MHTDASATAYAVHYMKLHKVYLDAETLPTYENILD